ncbi:4Fe-4S cluster-binding domain-containing protein, partial [Candidatus Bipolaricaulota bacterium]|nr:4Fe-4S cluster-binding domain-containing protein [Candidatus Bipolaricaulota bacterium]
MNLASWLPTTLIDYPGRVAATLFTSGCNFRCPFCHNPELVLPERVAALPVLDEEEILGEIERRRGFLDGIVLTGGEPTL